jgi:hypothetical protein
MANQSLGISFFPSDENAAQGPQRAQVEGAGGSDLDAAFRVLNLHLPKFLGARSLAPKRLLNSPGSAGVPGAFNPHAAVFEALLNVMNGGGSGAYGGSLSSAYGGDGGIPPQRPSAPSVIPGDLREAQDVFTGTPPAVPGADSRTYRPDNNYGSDPVFQRRRN